MSELVCPYCGLKVASYVGLCRHIMRYKKHGYKLLRCLEFDILNNQEKVKEDISKFFQ